MTQDADTLVNVGSDIREIDLHKVCNSNAPCKTNDQLVSDFFPVAAGSCAITTSTRITAQGFTDAEGNVTRWAHGNAEIYEVTGGCIPDGYGVVGTQDDGGLVVRKVEGDPSTNADCGSVTWNTSTAPSTGIPTSANPYPAGTGPRGTGGAGTGSNGIPGGSGLGPGIPGGGGGPIGCVGDCGPGGGGGSPPPGGGGGGCTGDDCDTAGTGDGDLTVGETRTAVRQGVREALEDQTDEELLPTAPGAGDYSSAVEVPESNSILTYVRGIISSSPVISAITGSGLSATGGICTLGFTALGRAATFDICWTETILQGLGTMLVALAGLYALYIAWGS